MSSPKLLFHEALSEVQGKLHLSKAAKSEYVYVFCTDVLNMRNVWKVGYSNNWKGREKDFLTVCPNGRMSYVQETSNGRRLEREVFQTLRENDIHIDSEVVYDIEFSLLRLIINKLAMQQSLSPFVETQSEVKMVREKTNRSAVNISSKENYMEDNDKDDGFNGYRNDVESFVETMVLDRNVIPTLAEKIKDDSWLKYKVNVPHLYRKFIEFQDRNFHTTRLSFTDFELFFSEEMKGRENVFSFDKGSWVIRFAPRASPQLNPTPRHLVHRKHSNSRLRHVPVPPQFLTLTPRTART
jgi:hypothetical protein